MVEGSANLAVAKAALTNVQFVETFYQRYIQPGLGHTLSTVVDLFIKN